MRNWGGVDQGMGAAEEPRTQKPAAGQVVFEFLDALFVSGLPVEAE